MAARLRIVSEEEEMQQPYNTGVYCFTRIGRQWKSINTPCVFKGNPGIYTLTGAFNAKSLWVSPLRLGIILLSRSAGGDPTAPRGRDACDPVCVSIRFSCIHVCRVYLYTWVCVVCPIFLDRMNCVALCRRRLRWTLYAAVQWRPRNVPPRHWRGCDRSPPPRHQYPIVPVVPSLYR